MEVKVGYIRRNIKIEYSGSGSLEEHVVSQEDIEQTNECMLNIVLRFIKVTHC